MSNENDFLSDLTDLVRLAKDSDNELTTVQIKEYFKGFELNDKQYVMIATYLSQKGIVITDFDLTKLDRAEEEAKHSHEDHHECHHDHDHEHESEEPENIAIQSKNHLMMYKNELSHLKKYTKQEKEELYSALLNGEDVKGKVIEANLRKVVTIASSFEQEQILLEDLIQEGNLVLMSVVDRMAGDYSRENKVSSSNFQTHLNSLVRTGLVNLIDDESMELSQVNTMLAKTNLIYEATKVMAEDLGRVATIDELSEFTHIDQSEIEDVVSLSLKEIKLGEGN